MLTLPDGVVAYRTIGPFKEDSVPKGLLREHNTKAGVWGFLQVESGQINYVITEPADCGVHTLSTQSPGVIAPEHKHHLELTGQVIFRVTFYRAPDE